MSWQSAGARSGKLVCVLYFLLFIFCLPVQGATFTVNSVSELEAAINSAKSNQEDDTIYITAGIYNLSNGIRYYYGAESEDFDLTIEGAGAGNTIIDGVAISDSFHSFELTPNQDDTNADFIIRNITFRNGVNGGVYLALPGNALLENCEFSNNNVGGGLVINNLSEGKSIRLLNNRFINNTANNFGGGAFIDLLRAAVDMTVIVRNNVFDNNHARSGGGLRVYTAADQSTQNPPYSYITVDRNIFKQNTGNPGGGLYAEIANGSLTVTNNIFMKNNNMGAIVLVDSADGILNIINNSFSGDDGLNQRMLYVGLENQNHTAHITNNVLWRSSIVPDEQVLIQNDQQINGSPSPFEFSYNAYQTVRVYFDADNYTISNNKIIAANPGFKTDTEAADPNTWDLHLIPGSSLRDSGSNHAAGLPVYDMDGESRIMNGIVDIGADEYFVDEANILVTDSAAPNDDHLIDFGVVMVASNSTQAFATIANTGTLDLHVSDIFLGGGHAADFSMDVTAGTNPCLSVTPTVAAGGSCDVGVVFTPADTSVRQASLTIVSDDVDEDSVVVQLQGTGKEPSEKSGDGEGGGCFIATAAYGSYMHNDVMVLRRFRDNVLLKVSAGRKMVDIYYAYSPPLADVIRGNAVLMWFTRLLLTPLLYLIKYPLAMITGLILMFFGVRVIKRQWQPIH